MSAGRAAGLLVAMTLGGELGCRLISAIGLTGKGDFLLFSTKAVISTMSNMAAAPVAVGLAPSSGGCPPRSAHQTYLAEQRWRSVQKFVNTHRLTYLKSNARQLHFDLVNAVEEEGVSGMILEAGVALGGNAISLAAAKCDDRPLHLYDTFTGIPPPSNRDGVDVHHRYDVIRAGKAKGMGGKMYYGYMEDLLGFDQEMFRASGFNSTEHNVIWHKGLFNETMQLSSPVAYAHIDGDWYDSVTVSLTRISQVLSIGGYIVFDDCFDFSGARSAVEDFFSISVHQCTPSGRSVQVGQDCYNITRRLKIVVRLLSRGVKSCSADVNPEGAQ